jgi:hypothetical protein
MRLRRHCAPGSLRRFPRQEHVQAEGADRVEAAERLRSLVSKIVLTPEDGRLVIDVHGDLAGILAIAHGKAPPARTYGAVARAKPNASKHGQNSLLKHKGRPWGAARVAEIARLRPSGYEADS